MECYACTNQATRQCRRCARVYCEVHGADLCAECLSPASALPSFNLYRGSLLALLVGSAFAIWLLVRPTGGGGGPEIALAEITPTSIVTEVVSSPTPATPATPAAKTPTAGATETPQPPASPTSAATPEPRRYIVQEGDTLLGIADRFAPVGVNPVDYAQQIVDASPELSSIDDPITPGQTLVLP